MVQKPFCKLGVLVHCLARTCESQLFTHIDTFCGCNCKTSNICNQQTRFLLPEHRSNWQRQFRLASLYSWHIMTSALHHD